MADNVHKTLILGSGPAGYTAAIYAARANLQPDHAQGHAARRPAHDHDRGRELPGLPGGRHGPGDDGALREAGERFGTETSRPKAPTVDLSQRPFKVESNPARRTTARA
jgi:thioredoxin reductase (NADPH)